MRACDETSPTDDVTWMRYALMPAAPAAAAAAQLLVQL